MAKANELHNAVNYLRSSIASYKSAKRSELPNEQRLLVDSINAVKALQNCRSAYAVDRAVNMIGEAMNVIEARSFSENN